MDCRYFEVLKRDQRGQPCESKWYVVAPGKKTPYVALEAYRDGGEWGCHARLMYSATMRHFDVPAYSDEQCGINNVVAKGCLFCEEFIYRKMRCPIELEQFRVEDGFCFLSQMRLLEQTSSSERVCYCLLFRNDLGLYRTNSVYVGEYWSRSYSIGWAVSGRSFPYVDRTFGCEADAIYQLDRMLGKVVLRQFGRVERLPTTGYHNRIEVYE